MSIKILMPALSPTMEVGNLQKWLVKIGDDVKAGDILAEIETDKATMEIEAVDEGKVTDILVKEGTEGIPVNTPIAILNGLTESNTNKIKKIPTKNEEKIEIKKDSTGILLKEDKRKNHNNNFKIDKTFIASPYAKKVATKNKIDLSAIKGSGPDGRIIKRDLYNLEKKEIELITSSKYKFVEPSSIRKIIAEKTTTTKNTIPHFYLTIESKVDKLIKLRKIINEDNSSVKISINDILVKALALAQKNNPKANVSWFNEKIVQYSSVDVSVAVALDEGLVTPIIKDADSKGLIEISKEIKKLINKAKEGKLTPEEYSGGTVSISNLGMYGIKEFSAIINPPQSSILAVGSIQKNIILNNGDLKEINILKSTLSADHRVLDGATAAKFLKDFNDIIENPFEIWLQSNDMKVK